jgi:Rps23 Pro-64 3,4-dihydroxylase Tpa1-like proline 4-hydroxylase
MNASTTSMIDDRPLSIETFLPLSRMSKLVAPTRIAYAGAKPFPHFYIDNFFDPEIMDAVLAEFPKPSEIKWQKFDSEKEIKLASAKEQSFGPMTRLLLYHMNSMTFLEFLSAVTGIDNLISDPSFEGGGLHQIQRGGKLGVHADFNKHPLFHLDRRLNALLYLNKDWKEEYGGHLELWNREVTQCEAKILPVFNRLTVFGTTDFTFHGHPNPLLCPEGVTRKSLALYYFSNGRPADEINGDSNTTLFKPRDASDFKPTFKQRLRGAVRDLLPPIVMRQIERRR